MPDYHRELHNWSNISRMTKILIRAQGHQYAFISELRRQRKRRLSAIPVGSQDARVRFKRRASEPSN